MATFPSSLHDLEYERFRVLILERSGLNFPEKRRPDLERGLRQAFPNTDCRDLDEYYHLLLEKPTAGPEWEGLISQLTVGETYFFRDRPQFEALRTRVLPEIIASRRQHTRQLRIWSAGCASGEEPYSIAMLLRELLPDLNAWSITILATDISREALNKARAAHYGDWSFREEGWEQMKERYFVRRGRQWELDKSVQEMVTFAYLNLVEDTYPALANNTVAFDLIVCRNVTIYFTPELTRRVVDQFHEALVEGGWLVVGHSEPSPFTYNRFEVRTFPGTMLYCKTSHVVQPDLSWLIAAEKTPPRPALRPSERSLVQLPPQPKPPPVRVVPATPAPPTGGKQAAAEASPTPANPCTEAIALLENGEIEAAVDQLRQVLQMHADCAQAYYLLGKIQANGGKWAEARQWCERALELDPLLAEGHFLLSLVYSQEGSVGPALQAMKRVVYLERNAPLGHFGLANLYSELGEGARMRKSLENAARLLEKMPEEEIIPWSDGMTAGRLLYAVRRQMTEAK